MPSFNTSHPKQTRNDLSQFLRPLISQWSGWMAGPSAPLSPPGDQKSRAILRPEQHRPHPHHLTVPVGNITAMYWSLSAMCVWSKYGTELLLVLFEAHISRSRPRLLNKLTSAPHLDLDCEQRSTWLLLLIQTLYLDTETREIPSK